MNIQKKLDKAVENYWAKFITSVIQLGNLKGLKGDRNNLLNSYFESFGFSSIGDNWKKITKNNAVDCLTYIISKSIAYDDEIISTHEASEIALEFLNKFDEKAKIFTNVSPNTWEPFKLSPSWDAAWNYEDYEDEKGMGYLSCIAVVIYDQNNIGILCKLESD